jgi:hypothetical protein
MVPEPSVSNKSKASLHARFQGSSMSRNMQTSARLLASGHKSSACELLLGQSERKTRSSWAR